MSELPPGVVQHGDHTHIGSPPWWCRIVIHHATQEEMFADVPDGTMRLQSGPESIWLIFRDRHHRSAFAARYAGTWMITRMRAARLDYCLDWKDVNGWGLELAQFAGPGTQSHRMRTGEAVPPPGVAWPARKRLAQEHGHYDERTEGDVHHAR